MKHSNHDLPFIRRLTFPILPHLSSEQYCSVAVYAHMLIISTMSGKCITEYEILQTVYRDLILSAICILIIGVFLVAHMESFFLGITALFQILLSFPYLLPNSYPAVVS